MTKEDYSAESIRVLKGLEAVRTRPGMYIGDTDDGSGLHHMIYEVVDNAIDECLAMHADEVIVTLKPDGSVEVTDNGRGIPVDIHKDGNRSAAEVIMTELHAGGKFDQKSYKVSGGLHGVGVSVVNALSDWLELSIHRNGKEHFLRFIEGGRVEIPLAVVGDSPTEEDGTFYTGTTVRFMASPKTFGVIDYKKSTVERRLRELAFLTAGKKIVFRDHRGTNPTENVMQYEGGVKSFVKWLNRNSENLIPEPIFATGTSDDGFTEVEAALQWTRVRDKETVQCFTNSIPQRDGGTHLTGFRNALTRAVRKYASESNVLGKKKVEISGDDARDGLTVVLSIKMRDPKFSSQTKDKLVSSEIRPVIEGLMSKSLTEWFEEHPKEAKEVMDKIVMVAEEREKIRLQREQIRNQSTNIASLPGKLADCQEKDPAKSELFIVEGDSAGGSAKQGRDRANQAILPLRGKIMNIERVQLTRMLSSEQVGTLIKALGTGIDTDFNIEKLRYHKIIIMTDADVDGAHIRTLLLTFFFRQMIEIIKKGYLYIAQPPLYKVSKGRSEQYLKDDEELNEYLITEGTKGETLILSNQQQIAGEDLRDHVVKAKSFVQLLKRLSVNHPSKIIEQVALSDALVSDIAQSDAAESARRLNQTNEEGESEWSGRVEEDILSLSRIVRGVEEKFEINRFLRDSADSRQINTLAKSMGEIFREPATLVQEDGNKEQIFGPASLLNSVLESGRHGMKIQRYKGLGEMNADQLWETTLDANARVLLQVKIDHEDEADDMFQRLMGERVEPRREFIQENALEAAVDI